MIPEQSFLCSFLDKESGFLEDWEEMHKWKLIFTLDEWIDFFKTRKTLLGSKISAIAWRWFKFLSGSAFGKMIFAENCCQSWYYNKVRFSASSGW